MRLITDFLYRNRRYDDTYVRLFIEGDSVLSKLLTVAILFGSMSAHARTGGDCYLTSSCPGNPSSANSEQSAFSDTNNSNINSFQQIASLIMDGTAVPQTTEASLLPGNGPRLNSKTRKAMEDEQYNIGDGVEQ